jgi:hypothetical protein
MLMHNGSITASGSTQNIINTYFSNDDKLLNDGIVPRDFKRAYNSGQGYIDKVITKNNTHHIKSNFFFKEQLSVKLEFELLIDIPDLIISFSVINDEMHKISYYEYPESSLTSLNLKNFANRKKEHLANKGNFPFHRALRANPDDFEWETFEDQSEGRELEQALLDAFFGILNQILSSHSVAKVDFSQHFLLVFCDVEGLGIIEFLWPAYIAKFVSNVISYLQLSASCRGC